MTLTVPLYRRDYQGEVITDGRQTPPVKYFVKPRELFYRTEKIPTRAMVIGNGNTRLNNPTFDLFMRTNQKRAMPGYKMTYACNGAAWDLNADYYVVTNRVLMGHITDTKLWSQFFVPSDMYIDYKIPHMIPFLNGVDSGTSAAFLAAFDGNKEVYLFGFDRQYDGINNNVYKGRPGYDNSDTAISNTIWDKNLRDICLNYKETKFYRVGANNTHKILDGLKNFQDISYQEAARLGDF